MMAIRVGVTADTNGVVHAVIIHVNDTYAFRCSPAEPRWQSWPGTPRPNDAPITCALCLAEDA